MEERRVVKEEPMDHDELRRLAEAATPGPWRTGNATTATTGIDHAPPDVPRLTADREPRTGIAIRIAQSQVEAFEMGLEAGRAEARDAAREAAARVVALREARSGILRNRPHLYPVAFPDDPWSRAIDRAVEVIDAILDATPAPPSEAAAGIDVDQVCTLWIGHPGPHRLRRVCLAPQPTADPEP